VAQPNSITLYDTGKSFLTFVKQFTVKVDSYSRSRIQMLLQIHKIGTASLESPMQFLPCHARSVKRQHLKLNE
jgi:hypothetical protein